MKRRLIFFLTAFFCLCLASCKNEHALNSARELPIQHNGRVKPLDTFARQTLKLVYGSERWQKKPAIDFLLGHMTEPAILRERRFIRLDYSELKNTLSLPADEHFFTYDELEPGQEKVEELVRAAKAKRDKDLRPSKLEQKAELLYTKLRTVEELVSGDGFKFIPSPGHGAWLSPYAVSPPFLPDFKALIQLYQTKDFAAFEKSAKEWKGKVAEGSALVSPWKIALEVQYSSMKPFQVSAFFYFLSLFILTLFKRQGVLYRLGLAALFTAVLFHTLGLGLRVIILGRPPVSNMYESVIFMNWALIVFALVFWLIKRNAAVLVTGAAVSGFVMLYGGLLPLDTGLEVLVPVLRSNYWLSIHVMTVVSSYGAFGLAMGLGHRHLFCVARGRFNKRSEKESAELIYKIIQLGVILIGTGTVLGGVWANESWGRFWGWDPKETWALITFLGYLIIVHLKFAKKLSHFQLALGSVLGFLLVLMTWYGVNFVLGRGLHSYGAGTGGMHWIVYYLVLEAAFVGWALLKTRRSF